LFDDDILATRKGHQDCLSDLFRSQHRHNYATCPICSKHVDDPSHMKLIWNEIRMNIERQPLRLFMNEIQVGYQLSTIFGTFLVESMEQIITSVTDVKLTRTQSISLYLLGHGPLPVGINPNTSPPFILIGAPLHHVIPVPSNIPLPRESFHEEEEEVQLLPMRLQPQTPASPIVYQPPQPIPSLPHPIPGIVGVVPSLQQQQPQHVQFLSLQQQQQQQQQRLQQSSLPPSPIIGMVVPPHHPPPILHHQRPEPMLAASSAPVPIFPPEAIHHPPVAMGGQLLSMTDVEPIPYFALNHASNFLYRGQFLHWRLGNGKTAKVQ